MERVLEPVIVTNREAGTATLEWRVPVSRETKTYRASDWGPLEPGEEDWEDTYVDTKYEPEPAASTVRPYAEAMTEGLNGPVGALAAYVEKHLPKPE